MKKNSLKIVILILFLQIGCSNANIYTQENIKKAIKENSNVPSVDEWRK